MSNAFKKVFCFAFLVLTLLIQPSFATLEKNVNFFSAWSWSNVDIKIFGNHVLTDKYGNVLKDNSISLSNVKDDYYEGDYEGNESFDGEWYFNGGSVTSPPLIVDNDLFKLFESFMNGDISNLPRETSIRYVCCKWLELESYQPKCSFINKNDECNEEPGKMFYLLYEENESKKEECYSFCHNKFDTTKNSSLIEKYIDCVDQCFKEKKIFRSEVEFFSDLFGITFHNATMYGGSKILYPYNVLCKLENGFWCSAIHFRQYSSGLRFSKPVLIFGDEELKKEFGVGSDSLIYYNKNLKNVVVENPGFNFKNITTLEDFAEKNIKNYDFKDEEDALKKLVSINVLNVYKDFSSLKIILNLKINNDGKMPVEIKDVLFFDNERNYTFNSLLNNNIIDVSETKELIFYTEDFCSMVGRELSVLIRYSPYNYFGSKEFVFEKTIKINFEKDLFRDYYEISIYYPVDDFFVYEANPSIINNDRIDLHVGNQNGVLRTIIKTKPIEKEFDIAKLRFNVYGFNKKSVIRFYPISSDFNINNINFVLVPKTYESHYDVMIDRKGEYFLDITDVLKDKVVYGFFVKAYDESLDNDIIINSLESDKKPKIILLKKSDKKHNLIEKIC
ncbi:MAG: hypothetical protein QXU20_00540 [Candidatus Woesearchaeota archaeon]